MKINTRYSLDEEVFYYDVNLDKVIRSVVTSVRRDYFDSSSSTYYSLESTDEEDYCVIEIDHYLMTNKVDLASTDLIAKTEKELLERKNNGLFESTLFVQSDEDFGEIREYCRFTDDQDLDIYDETDVTTLQMLEKEFKITYADGAYKISTLQGVSISDKDMLFSFGTHRDAFLITVDNVFRHVKIIGSSAKIKKVERV